MFIADRNTEYFPLPAFKTNYYPLTLYIKTSLSQVMQAAVLYILLSRVLVTLD
jgi:hypothetical protein